MKPAKLRTEPADTKAMASYLAMFGNLTDAQAFESAVLKTKNEFLPPCARVVRDGGTPTAIYWRWLAAMAEAWS